MEQYRFVSPASVRSVPSRGMGAFLLSSFAGMFERGPSLPWRRFLLATILPFNLLIGPPNK